MDDIDRLFREFHRPIVRYLARRLGDHDLAEELAQETFLRASRHVPLANARAWLFMVATNLMRDEARRTTRRRRQVETLRAEQQQNRPQSYTPSNEPGAPELTAEQTRAQALVRSALDALGERDRAALLLREEGLDYHEIAATLGLAVGSVGTTLSRAQRRLVDHYESLANEHHVRGGADVA